MNYNEKKVASSIMNMHNPHRLNNQCSHILPTKGCFKFYTQLLVRSIVCFDKVKKKNLIKWEINDHFEIPRFEVTLNRKYKIKTSSSQPSDITDTTHPFHKKPNKTKKKSKQ